MEEHYLQKCLMINEKFKKLVVSLKPSANQLNFDFFLFFKPTEHLKQIKHIHNNTNIKSHC